MVLGIKEQNWDQIASILFWTEKQKTDVHEKMTGSPSFVMHDLIAFISNDTQWW